MSNPVLLVHSDAPSGALLRPTAGPFNHASEATVLEYKRYVPPGVVPILASVVCFGVTFSAPTQTQGDISYAVSYSAQFEGWIVDAQGNEIFRVLFSKFGTGPTPQNEAAPFTGSATGAQGQVPVQFAGNAAGQESPPVARAGGSFGSFHVRVQSPGYLIQVPYGARVYTSSKYSISHPSGNGTYHSPEIENQFISFFQKPIPLLARAVMIPTAGGVWTRGEANYNTGGIGSLIAGQTIYVRDGQDFDSYESSVIYAPPHPSYGEPIDRFFHRAKSAQPITGAVLWHDAGGASNIVWSEITHRRAPAFTCPGPVYENMAGVVGTGTSIEAGTDAQGSGLYGQHLADKWISLRTRTGGARMGGVLSGVDARILWVEQSENGAPWLLRAMQPKVGGTVEELEPAWTDPDVIYLHVIDTPDGGGAALAVYEKITPVRSTGGDYTFSMLRKWLFKKSADRLTWPPDEEAIEVATLPNSDFHGTRPATLVWREGALLASSHFGHKFISRRGGVENSWEDI